MPYQIFSTSGNWTVPLTADPTTIKAYAWGEGGNSGDALSGVSGHSAGGGGAGAIAGEVNLGGLRVGSVLNFTIGQGGTGVNTVITGASVTITANAGSSGSGLTAGTGGTAGGNSIAFAGGPGGTGLSGAGHGGAGGGGSPGSTGAGGAGSNGGATNASGGSAGTGAAGPPSLAGAVGGTGGTPANTGSTNGNAPGSGAGGPGNNSTHGANSGAPGQVIIIWNTLNGVGLPSTLVSIAAFLPTPSPSGLKVTATAGGAAVNGILLRVRVLDNAAFTTPVNSGTVTASASQAADVALTPEFTGSLAYSVVVAPPATTPAAATGNTAIDAVGGAATFVSSATLTANTPFTAGSASTPASGGCAAVEVSPFGGTITTDASSPAVVNNGGATSATTALFTPPAGGKLILALVSAQGGSGAVAMALADSHGLTWTQAAAADTSGNSYAGAWYAYTPAGLTFYAITPVPGLVGTPYTYTLAALGGYGNYGWSLTSGSLPAGLSLNGATGVISGTPTTTGLSVFTVTLSDGFGNTLASPSISMVINESF